MSDVRVMLLWLLMLSLGCNRNREFESKTTTSQFKQFNWDELHLVELPTQTLVVIENKYTNSFKNTPSAIVWLSLFYTKTTTNTTHFFKTPDTPPIQFTEVYANIYTGRTVSHVTQSTNVWLYEKLSIDK